MADPIKTKPNLVLNWTSPICIPAFSHIGKGERGVYLWGFTINENFVPYYVGIADDILLRINKHIRCILCGEYTIYHSISLANFNEFKHEPPKVDSGKGKLYEPDLPDGFHNFLCYRQLLQPHIDFMVNTFTFFYAAVNNEISGQDLKEIEKICINQIGKEKLANTRMGNSDKFFVTHNGCASFNYQNDKNK